MSNNRPSLYQDRYQTFAAEAKALQQKDSRIAYLRLILFLSAIGISVLLFRQFVWQYGAGFIVLFLVFFAWFAKWHDKIKAERDYKTNLSEINQNELALLQHQFDHITDTGEQFKDAAHPYTDDLDIFGQKSIYTYLNRAHTLTGKNTLANGLRYPANYSPPTNIATTEQQQGQGKKQILAKTLEAIQARQTAIAELKERLEWRQDFQAKSRNIIETPEDIPDIVRWVNAPFFIINSRFMQGMIFGLPVLMATLMVLFFLGYIGWTPLIVAYLVNLSFIKFSNKEVTNVIEQTAQKNELIKVYEQLIGSFEKEGFEAAKLVELQAKLKVNEQAASQQIQRLSGLSSNLNVRQNVMAYFVLNTLFLWELIFCRRLEQWKQQMQGNMNQWFEVIGEVEMFNSLANMQFNHPDWIVPTISTDYFQLKAQDLGHCLIEPQKRVCNDVDMQSVGAGKILLITGSNMAGKSTFLRTMGINVVLAMMGAPVCAKQFDCSVALVYSNMRTFDALQDSASSFYAELYGLKRTIDAVEGADFPVFFLLDEILKGTNSQDRHQGSVALIHQLLHHQGVGLVSTHDLDLCALANDIPNQALENWCFEVQIDGEQMIFDYTFKKGVCQSMNATLLMKQMGIAMGGESVGSL